MGVDPSGIVRADQGRVGTYFVEFAAPPLPIRVTYDRADSACTRFTSGEVDWEWMLDTRALHLTGITPALSPSCRELVGEAADRARERGVQVSFDVNHRAQLWSDHAAAEALRPLLRAADLLLCKRDDAERLFGISGAPNGCWTSFRTCPARCTWS